MKLVDYFADGSLINILQTSNGPVWVTLRADGSYHYGFGRESSSSVGGQPVPLGTVHKEKIFLPEKEQVIEYLQTFGLSKADAELVVLRIGTEPSEIGFDGIRES
jgi:hypothetical protein